MSQNNMHVQALDASAINALASSSAARYNLLVIVMQSRPQRAASAGAGHE
jgi:hypothetical protein